MNKYLEIDMLLDDINEYVSSTLFYLRNPNSKIDIDELIMYLSTVDETINNIKKILSERMN